MAVPTLKDFNRLLDSAQDEIAAWAYSPSGQSVRIDSISYLRDLIGVMQNSDHVGTFRATLNLAIGTVQAMGAPLEQVSPSLLKASKLLARRERKTGTR